MAAQRENRENAGARQLTDDERRTEVVNAALAEFASGGYAGTTTSAIADRAGIRQPYIYALFENKRALFLACHEVLNQQILEAFRRAAGPDDSPVERLRQMSLAYCRLLQDENRAQFHLQVFAAAGNDELKLPIREGLERLFEEALELSGAPRPEVARFFAAGIFLNALTVLDGPSGMISNLDIPPDTETSPKP